MNSFQDKVVVITGAGNGIGRALAQLLAKQGAKLALNSRTASHLEETVRSLGLDDSRTFTRAFDISDKRAVFQFASDVNEHFGQVDVVINNAGVAITGLTFEELEISDFEWIFSINFMGVVFMSKAFLPVLKNQKSATALVNVSSLFGMVPMALKTPYCSTKYAVRGLTDSLRMELLDSNVKVIGVYPGGVKTSITAKALKAETEPRYTKTFEKLLVMPPEEAAQIIANGILQSKENIIVGKDAKKAIFAYRWLPSILNKMALKTMREFKGKKD
ncbi:MAG: SDR family NAD(P)-dependent oxidoreductase [Flavobacteriales bacterium]|nr:SDR family NAD(P)-dependent oxidoreductase [Flavobacteriales bacterium]